MEEKRKRLGIVTYGMLGGGIEVFILNLGVYFQKREFDVTIITTEIPGAWFHWIEKYGLKELHIEGLGYHSPAQHVRKVASALYDGQFDVLILNHARFAQAGLGMGKTSPVVIPVVNSTNEFFAQMSAYKSDLCESVVAVSPAVAQIAYRSGIKCPVEVILNGVAWPEMDVQVISRNYEQRELKLLYAGRVRDEQKGVFLLPEIIKRLVANDVKLTLDIVGDGPDLIELQKRFKEYNLEDHIKYWGNVEVAVLHKIMRADHVLLFPSYYEGLPLMPMEASLCGCVSVASFLEGITDDMITDGQNGFLVKCGDIGEFCRCIELLYNDRGLLRKVSDEALNYATNNFTLDIMGQQYYDLITRAINNQRVVDKSNNINDERIIPFISGSPIESVEFYNRQWVQGFEQDCFITKKFNCKKVAIYGTLRNGLYFLFDLRNTGAEVMTFIDSNKELHGKSLNGISINGLRWLDDNYDTIDAVLISIESQEDEKVKEELIKKYARTGLAIYTWKELLNASQADL
ncbi:glycosyltransferase family 4 protein [Pelosinus propionicus]|uniref:Glycosyltransferase involved in cell wall bisynthesis n=1 Tax=Pelosinus propionicus DSM 13327 TaxID=1123291 RepID=A0A1I4HUX0_9FIRM|nr:glycosyltransferase family 4 protein [Pelosinus propionicus]SFL45411.1 Glycosyltransferase involved in cell wall bisynthesis [Pelosinus propionicus DSM 13327]